MINQLITNLYEPTHSLPFDEPFYREVLKEMESNTVSSQIYFLLNKQQKLAQTPLFFQQKLKKSYQAALYQNVFIKRQAELLLKEFDELEIKTIPLKGVFFAENYFGHIGARGTSDIDLLIKKEDLNKAVKTVKSLGFEIEEEPIPSHFHTSLSKQLPGSPFPLTVEIHWNILKENTASFQIKEFWNEAVPLQPYQHVKLLSDSHTFYMMCLHGWRHNMDSPKYFLDIIQLIYVLQDRLDYEALFNKAKHHRTGKRLKRTLLIVYSQYPMLEKIVPLPITKKQAANFKNKRISTYIQFLDYQFLSYDSMRHSSVEMMSWLFPSKSDILSQLKQSQKRLPYVFLLSRLYQQRCTSAVKALCSIF